MSERSQKVTQLLDLFKTFTVLEVKELVDAFESEFGVTAAAPAVAMVPGAAGAAAAEAAPEKTSFDVILKSGGAKKIQVIKEIRAIVSGLGLKEAKDLVDGAPKPIKQGVSKEEAEQIKQKVEAAGGEVEVK